jgi:hypothetical protein
MKRGVWILLALALGSSSRSWGEPASLNMGLDYKLRAVAINDNDGLKATADRLNYTSQSARFYMTSWLNEDVEAAFRLHSIGFWGVEGSTGPTTRYPSVNGTPWVEQAYVHLPHLFNKRADVTIGRQPITLGDGMIVSDDQLGFNAFRLRLNLPLRVDADAFTAKGRETLAGSGDTDLLGVVLGTEREHNRWELAWVQEAHRSATEYVLGVSTLTADRVIRRFVDLRLFGDLKDAYYKAEVALQSGRMTPAGGASSVDIKGMGQRLELGAQSDTERFGRFGVKALYAAGTGDDAGSPGADQAFRPGFARRWDGLQRSGFGGHFAATLSDAYDPSAPFSPTAGGLPPGVSGIKTLGLGVFTVQKVFWIGSADYYFYDAAVSPTPNKDLGAELDFDLTFRYTGYVTFSLGADLFFPGKAFSGPTERVSRYTAETHLHF